MTRFILIRHGQSLANLQGIFAGHLDVALSPLGEQQARVTAEYIKKNFAIDCVYSSDLKRARDTALAVGEAFGLPVSPHQGLREVFAGEWEGMTFDELQTGKLREGYALWLKNVGCAHPNGGESVVELQKRVVATLEAIAKEHPGQTVAIGTHATPLRAVICHAMGLPAEQMKAVPWVSNASVTVIDVCDGKFLLQTAGYAQHQIDAGLSSHFPANV